MKKIYFLLSTIVIVSVSLIGMASIATANEGPHGAYTITTEKCAGCHRPHTATRSKLLKGDSVDTTLGNATNYDIADFCFSCHKDGAGANNNVYDGYFMGYLGPGDAGTPGDIYDNPWPGESTDTSNLGTKNAGLNGGGFVSAKAYWGSPYKMTYNGRTKRGVAWTDTVANHFDHTATDEAATTSSHNAMDDLSTWTVWGSLTTGSTATVSKGPGMLVTLKCTSCHDQHGSRHYRILRDSRSDSKIGTLIPGYVTQRDQNGAALATLYPDQTTQIESWESEFTSGGLTKDYTSYAYKVPLAGTTSISDFCKTCHSQYYNENNASKPSYSTYDAGDGLGSVTRYRHYTEVTIGSAPGGCGSGCAAPNLNSWIQLPLAVDNATVTNGKRGGVPIYQADIDGSEDYLVCTTCHQAHGTSAVMIDGSKVGPTRTATGSDPGHSNLLRLDNRGVCEDCHGWTPAKDEDGLPCDNQYDTGSCVNTIGEPVGP